MVDSGERSVALRRCSGHAIRTWVSQRRLVDELRLSIECSMDWQKYWSDKSDDRPGDKTPEGIAEGRARETFPSWKR